MRAHVDAMDALIGVQHRVLDHGFVTLVDYMGDDDAIVQAARVSTGSHSKSPEDDEKLIRYLMRHEHTSPFEMASIKLRMRLPIFVARQLIRHRTASVNEFSARYTKLPDVAYVPEVDQIRAQSKVNHQGSDRPIDPEVAALTRERTIRSYHDSFATYDHNLMLGVARELARVVTPVGTYTEWYWKIDLHNLLRTLKLRCDSHAQYEIRVYADVLADIVRQWVPMTYRAWVDYKRDAVTFSRPMMAYLRQVVEIEDSMNKPDGVSDREWEDFRRDLGI